MTQENMNVVDIRTKKPLLPVRFRAAIMAQYMESKESDHSADVFLQKLEESLIATAASEVLNLIRNMVGTK